MNYPKGTKTSSDNSYVRFDNRGMGLEEDINLTNQYYIDNNIAFIYKKPTPIQVTKIDYKNNRNTKKEMGIIQKIFIFLGIIHKSYIIS